MSYYTNSKNPYTNLIDRPYVLWSASQGGASSSAYRLGTTDVTIPAAPNYPPAESGASTSYFIFTKWDFYKTSTNSTQFYLYNETQAKVITIVDQDAILSNYTGKFMGQGSEKRNVIECHVGTTSNQASDVISYKAITSGSAFDAYEVNNFEVDSLTVNSSAMIFNSTAGVYFNSTKSINFYGKDNIIVSNDFLIDTSTCTFFHYNDYVSNDGVYKRSYYSFGSYLEEINTTSLTIPYYLSIIKKGASSTTVFANAYIYFQAKKVGGVTSNFLSSTEKIVSILNYSSEAAVFYGNGGIKETMQTLTSDVSNANLNTAFGNSTSLGSGFIGFFTTGGAPSLALSNGTTVWYVITSTAAI